MFAYAKENHILNNLKRLKDSKSKAPEVIQEALDEVQAIITEVGAERRQRLYDRKAIIGEDYQKILLAMQNLFNYLNRRFGNIEQLNKKVGEMIKTLYDPEVHGPPLAAGQIIDNR